MNLTEYKEQQSIICDASITNFIAGKNGFEEGFEKALSLDLPIKFAEWIEDNYFSLDDACLRLNTADTAEVYNYWIQHIYSVE